jgi:hypothetical protein
MGMKVSITPQELLDRYLQDNLTRFQKSIFELCENSTTYQLGKLSVCFPEYVQAFEMIKYSEVVKD